MASASDHIDHVSRDVDRLYRIDQGALDGLLDPPEGPGMNPGVRIHPGEMSAQANRQRPGHDYR